MISRRYSTASIVISLVLAVGCLILAGILAFTMLLASTVPTSIAGLPSPTPAATTSTYDPYVWYFVHSPIGARHLTRSQALERVRQGCGQSFAPGTVDAVLAEAYKGICK